MAHVFSVKYLRDSGTETETIDHEAHPQTTFIHWTIDESTEVSVVREYTKRGGTLLATHPFPNAIVIGLEDTATKKGRTRVWNELWCVTDDINLISGCYQLHLIQGKSKEVSEPPTSIESSGSAPSASATTG